MTFGNNLLKLSLFLLIVFSITGCSHEEYDKQMVEIAKVCKEQIVRMKLSPISKFDAYYDPSNSKWNWFGTDEERFKFRKCLIENGVELGEQKKE
jgi:hypothetical protein